MYVLLVKLQVKPEHREAYLPELLANARGSIANEPGCLRFDVMVDESNPTTIYVHEVYRDKAAFEQGHRTAPHFIKWRDAVRDWNAAPPEVWRGTSVFPSASHGGPPPAALAARPPGFEPDRPEIMNNLQDAATIEIAPGVAFQPLVGNHNGARKLTTGIVTFAPAAGLPCHTHPFPEAVSLLAGQAAVVVEGRRYHLGHLDAVMVPRDTPHEVVNVSALQPVVLHMAMASTDPARKLVKPDWNEKDMSVETDGLPGKEQVRRFDRTPAYELSPGAMFKDWFNLQLGCREMSGGYGLFAPGASLPCHMHDFDESISIVHGRATCLVEGRRYTLADCGTALVPHGRCHYFINDSRQPMAMIWTYAGPMPERIVLAEECCC